MIETRKVGQGIAKYIETEITPQFIGWQRLTAETAAGLFLSRLPETVKALSTHPAIGTLGVINGEQIDVDRIYQEAIKHFGNVIDVDLPVVGTLHFSKDDLTTLYRTIKEV
jgi:hypothetical protein